MPSWFGIKKTKRKDPLNEAEFTEDSAPLATTEPTAESPTSSRKNAGIVKGLKANGIEQDPSPHTQEGPKVPVYVNVYNLMNPQSNKKFGYLGVGIYHSGVVVHGIEYSFGGSKDSEENTTGVFGIPPRTALPDTMFNQSVPVGETTTTPRQLEWILRGMGREWTKDSYQLLSRNCNHFSEELTKKLGCNFPSWVNRAAKLSNALVPKSVIDYVLATVPTPPTEENTQQQPHRPNCKCSRNCRQHQQRGGGGGAGAGESESSTPAEAPPIPEDLSKLSVRQLRTLMFLHNISWADCLEKGDMHAKLKQKRLEQS